MTPEEIQQIIEMLAEKLGPMGEHIWNIYLRQVYISVMAETLLALLLLGIGLGAVGFGVYAIRRYRRERKADRWNTSEWDLAAAFSLIMGGCFVLLGLLASGTLFKLLNPEFYALQMLLGR